MIACVMCSNIPVLSTRKKFNKKLNKERERERKSESIVTLSNIEIHGYWFLYIPGRERRDGRLLYKLIKSVVLHLRPMRTSLSFWLSRSLCVNWLPFISHGSLRARHRI